MKLNYKHQMKKVKEIGRTNGLFGSSHVGYIKLFKKKKEKKETSVVGWSRPIIVI